MLRRATQFGFIATLVALPALAQTSAVRYPPPCDASQVTKADAERAHAVFLSGKQFLDESNYDKAISYFDDAYSINCSVHAVLPIIATAYERKGDKAEAVRALEEYLKRAPGAPDHETIEHRIRNLKDQLAREAPPPATSVAPAASTAPPAPSAAAPPAASEPPPPPPPSPLSPPPAASSAPSPEPQPTEAVASRHGAGPWVVVGIGGAAAVTGAVLFGIGANDYLSAQKDCPPPSHTCKAGSGDAVSKGNTGLALERWGGVVGGVGLAATAAGLIWHFLEKPSPSASAHVVPVMAPGYAGVAGSF